MHVGAASAETDTRADGAREPDSGTIGQADLASAARRLLEQGGETARAAADTASALSDLAEAELALARAAAPRAALLGIAAFGLAVVAALYALALLVALLHRSGLDWPMALLVATSLALLGALVLIWRARRIWQLTRFSATRRQFARLLGDQA